MRSQSIRRGLVVAATATGLLALGATGAQAAELPSAGGTLGAVTHGVTHGTQHALKHTVKGAVRHTVKGTVRHTVKTVTGTAGKAAGTAGSEGAGKSVTHTVDRTTTSLRGTARRALSTPATAAKGAGDGVTNSAGKAVTHVTQEAGKALPAPKALPAGAAKLGDTVSGIQAAATPQAAQGLPQNLNIGIPEVIPGVPSIGILPLSTPALPFTPTVPFL